jgi:hypothetical protein
MTDVADSSRVMVDLIEVFALLYQIMNISNSDKVSFRLPQQVQFTTCVATELFR